MLRTNLINGVRLGFTAGLIVTLSDSLFMLKPNIFFPISYPVTIFAFNLFFWTLMGAGSALPLSFFSRRDSGFNIRQNHYWILFFLLPFSIFYGFLGRINVEKPINLPFDYHLSFFWVFLLVFFLFFALKRGIVNRGKIHFSFIPEFTAIVFLYLFCSNVSELPYLKGFFYLIFGPKTQVSGDSLLLKSYLIIIYLSVVFMTFLFYGFVFRKVRFFYQKKTLPLFLLFLITIGVLTISYKISYFRFLNKNYSGISIPQKQLQKNTPSVILIVLDTVRADRLSVYGFKPAGKNYLEKFSRDAIVFDNCIASSSWTYPSHASLFTGLYPVEHGNHDNINEVSKPVRMKSLPPLNEKFTTLADVFKRSGYLTAGVISNYTLLHKGLNFNKGFDVYDCSPGMGIVNFSPFRPVLPLICYLTNYKPKFYLPYRSAEDTNTNIYGLLEKIKAVPFFMFINYMDAHNPYSPPRPFSTNFSDRRFPNLYRSIALLPEKFVNTSYESWVSFLSSQYNGEIAYLDSQLNSLFSSLKQLGLYDSSLIVITSDHGELFNEHGLSLHKVPLYQGVVRVPLLIKLPLNKRSGRNKTLITLSDVYTTILNVCGLAVPEGLSGKAFGNSSEPVVTEIFDVNFGIHRALYDGKYKYMNYGNSKASELYDLAKDPQEKKNLASELTEVTESMAEKLMEWERQHPPRYDLEKNNSKIDLPSEVEDGLKALGYIQ